MSRGGPAHRPRLPAASRERARQPAASLEDSRLRLRLQIVVAALVALFLAIAVVTVTSLDAPTRAEDATKSLPPYWTVRRGQTYTAIATKTGLSIDQLETFNPYQDPDALRPGQHIKLHMHPPPLHPKRVGPRVWTVRRGQTFASIADRTGHSIYALMQLNPRLNPVALQPGQRMRLRP